MGIYTAVEIITRNDTIDLTKSPGAMDISFKNYGTTTVRISPKGGGGYVDFAPGDPMQTWGGYEGYYRSDFIKVEFIGAGTNLLRTYVTIDEKCNKV